MRIIPTPPGPGGVAIAAMVSSVLPPDGVCSEELNESILLVLQANFVPGPFRPQACQSPANLSEYYEETAASLLILAGLPSSGRTFFAFAARAIDQHLFKKALSHAPAADILVILQSQVNDAAF